MFANMSTLLIIEMCLKVVAPCAVAFLRQSNLPAVAGMDAGKKDVLIDLLTALNSGDAVKKAAMKEAQKEVEKIQGG